MPHIIKGGIKTMMSYPAAVASKLNEGYFDDNKARVLKVRPPRFVSFRMELETYNRQKALALQMLNDINLQGQVAEHISKVFTFKRNSLIMTVKRIICVQSKQKKHSKKD